MPMFAWLGYRGTLREATGVLLVVAAVATEATALGVGPVDALSTRYGLPEELVDAYLQVFLLDCGCSCCPLAVAVGPAAPSRGRGGARARHPRPHRRLGDRYRDPGHRPGGAG